MFPNPTEFGIYRKHPIDVPGARYEVCLFYYLSFVRNMLRFSYRCFFLLFGRLSMFSSWLSVSAHAAVLLVGLCRPHPATINTCLRSIYSLWATTAVREDAGAEGCAGAKSRTNTNETIFNTVDTHPGSRHLQDVAVNRSFNISSTRFEATLLFFSIRFRT